MVSLQSVVDIGGDDGPADRGEIVAGGRSMTAALVHAVALYGAAALVLLTVPVLCWIAAHGEPADVHLSDWP